MATRCPAIRSSITLLLATALLLPAPSQAGSGAKSTVVRVVSQTKGVPQQHADALVEALQDELINSGQFANVYTDADLAAIASREREKEAWASCTAESCLAEVAGALGIAATIRSRVTRLAKRKYQVSLRFIAGERVADSVTRTVGSAGVEELLEALREAARELVARQEARLNPEQAPPPAPAPPAVDPCQRPAWIDHPPDGLMITALGGGSGWTDPRLQLLEAAALAREELARELRDRVNQLAKDFFPGASNVPGTPEAELADQVVRDITDANLVNTQVVRRWSSCDGAGTYVLVAPLVAAGSDANTPQALTSSVELRSRVDRALPQSAGRPPWVDAPPPIDKVLLGLGLGATPAEAEALAWTDLAFAVSDKIQTMSGPRSTTDEPGAVELAREIAKHSGIGPTGCDALPHALVRRWHDPTSGDHYALAATSVGASTAATACSQELGEGADRAKEDIVREYRRAQQHITARRPVQARPLLLSALRRFQTLGNRATLRRMYTLTRRPAPASENEMRYLDLATQPGMLHCPLTEETAPAPTKDEPGYPPLPERGKALLATGSCQARSIPADPQRPEGDKISVEQIRAALRETAR